MTVERADVVSAVAELSMDTGQKIELVAQAVGIETVAYLRSLTSEMRPPARPGGQSRKAHPGHWADVSGQLANSYAWEVERRGPDEVVLALRNYAEYAAMLEVKEGFFVLRGVADPGGPVEQVMRRVVQQIAPDWKIEVA